MARGLCPSNSSFFPVPYSWREVQSLRVPSGSSLHISLPTPLCGPFSHPSSSTKAVWGDYKHTLRSPTTWVQVPFHQTLVCARQVSSLVPQFPHLSKVKRRVIRLSTHFLTTFKHLEYRQEVLS